MLNEIRTLGRRIFSRADRFVFPEETSPDGHWLRIVMNEAVDRYLTSLDPPSCRAAEISGNAHAHYPWRSYRSLDFPEFDLCAPLADEEAEYDVVICEQVLEHVADPWTAAENLRNLCAPGGHVVVTTPFLVRVHELPMYAMHDYWRFTPRGIRSLLEHSGLTVDEVGAWGNAMCVVGNLRRWSGYRRWHSLRNQVDAPVQVWAFAHRP